MKKNYSCTSQQQSCQTKQVQVSVGWFAEQDEKGDMENINHFLVFHPEVGLGGSGLNQSRTGFVQLHLGWVPQGLWTQGGGSEGWHRKSLGWVMHQGLKTIFPKAAFPGGDGWCGAPQLPAQHCIKSWTAGGGIMNLREHHSSLKGTLNTGNSP